MWTKQAVEELIKDANIALKVQQKKLDETEDALRRCRNLLASEKECTARLTNKLKSLC